MALLKRLLTRPRRWSEDLEDAVCSGQHHGYPYEVRGVPGDAICAISITARSVTPRGQPGGGKARQQGADAAAASCPGPPPGLADLPLAAEEQVWRALSDADRRAARLAARGLFRGAVRRVALSPGELVACGDLAVRFPGLSEVLLVLPPPSDAALTEAELAALCLFARGPAAGAGLAHVHTLDVDGRVRGAALAAVARLAAAAPSLQRVRLPGLRLGGAASRRSSDAGGGGRRSSDSGGGSGGADPSRDERHLCGLLDALPGLVELHLGCASRAGGAAAAAPGPAQLTPAMLRRVSGLRLLEVLTADASGPRDGRAAAALLRGLPLLRRLVLRFSAPAAPGGGGGGPELAAALGRLTQLDHLELESGDAGEDFSAALRLGGLTRLQVLSLGMCSGLTPHVLATTASLPHLHRVVLPFHLDADALRLLATLPALTDLHTAASVRLGGAAAPPPSAGGAPAPLSILSPLPVALPRVTKLVAASLRAGSDGGANDEDEPDAAWHGPRRELAAVFPGLRSLHVRRGGDAELRLAAGCAAKLETLVLSAAPRASDAGLVLLAGCRGLARLQIEGASRLTGDGFARLFSVPAPALQHLALHGVLMLSDDGMLATTAACRRLASVSLALCPELTDKTLSRLARLEKLHSVQLVRLGYGVTADGVRALAAAPAMGSVHVAGCAGVRAAGCLGHRPSVRIRVDDVDA